MSVSRLGPASALVLVVLGVLNSATAALPGANGRIVFVDDNGIYTVNADGGAKTELSQGGVNADPAWAPDGSRLAYAGWLSGERTYDLYVVDRSGSGRRKLLDDPAWHDGQPSWSPDGKEIAYVRFPVAGGRTDVHVVPASGGAARLLRVDAYDPAWAPDGAHIALAGTTARGSRQILVVDADGANERQVTHHNYGPFAPAWSPDGSKIAFISPESGRWEVYVVNVDGTGERRLTSESRLASGTVPQFGPAWSPDGRWITFAYDRDGTPRLFVMRADGTGQRPLLQLSGDLGSTSGDPDWQPASDLAVAAGGRGSAVTARVRNLSPLPARNATVTADVVGRAALVSARMGRASCNVVRRRAVCQIGELSGFGRAVAVLHVRRAASGATVVRLRVTSDTAEAQPRNNSTTIRVKR